MSSPGSGPGESVWATRRARAVHLLGETPHAEEILAFYVGLIEIQERVAERVGSARWSTLVASEDDDFPLLHLERLPLDELVPHFDDFLAKVAEVGTEVITQGARALLTTDVADREGLLSTALDPDAPDPGPADDVQAGFYARAFLEPLVTSLAAADSRVPSDWTQGHCFRCGCEPGVAVLRDLPDALGSRSLVCGMCATEWRFSRLTCSHCGETKADRLIIHTAESIAHVRIEECKTCERYLKTVDLRVKGDAIPLVDEVATVELDLWARDRGMTKLRVNVLGL